MARELTVLKLIMLIPLLLYFSGCDTGIGVQPLKDPRTYNWTADTLRYPGSYQTLMEDIWGSSPRDVYAVGDNSRGSKGIMWHYDGIKWTNVHLSISEGGEIEGAIDLTSIYGFSSTDIYAVGYRISYNPNPPPTYMNVSLIIHFDGFVWKEVNTYSVGMLVDIYGKSPSDIWAGGDKNTLYQYNGNVWERDSINYTAPPGYIMEIASISYFNSSYYALVYCHSTISPGIEYFFKRSNGNWEVQDSIDLGSGNFTFGLKLNQSKTNSFYSVGLRGVFKYNGASWDNIYGTITTALNGIWGTSDDNIFVAGSFGEVFHFNGVDWKQIEQLNDYQTDYRTVWTEGTQAFVIGWVFDGVYQKTIVWHGN